MTTRNPIGGLDALADGWEPTSPRPKVQEGPVGPQTPPTVPPMNFTTTLHLIQVNERCAAIEARLAALEANAAPSTPPESAANAPEGSPFDGVTGEEVLDAIRIWRKVQACVPLALGAHVNAPPTMTVCFEGNETPYAFRLLAWLKDGAE